MRSSAVGAPTNWLITPIPPARAIDRRQADLARDHAQQRGLARPVRPDERDPGAFADAEAHVGEQLAAVGQHVPDRHRLDVAHEEKMLGERAGGVEGIGRIVGVDAGLVVIDKPAGLTSHDVVARLRRILRTRKIGHAGTLDPMATGVLVCGVERGTKLLGHLALDTKAYTATIRLGAATTTDDAEGEVVSTADPTAVTDAAVAAGVAALTGAIQQVPSSVSAIKVDGKRAYALVRAGEEVALPARPVVVSAFDVLARRGADLDVAVECSSGTYVRALARDLGAALGVGGHLTALRRTRGGSVHARARPHPGGAGNGARRCRSRSTRRCRWRSPAATPTPAEAADLAHGRPLPPAGVEGVQGVFAPDGHVLALVRDRDGRARPVVVLAPA